MFQNCRLMDLSPGYRPNQDLTSLGAHLRMEAYILKRLHSLGELHKTRIHL